MSSGPTSSEPNISHPSGDVPAEEFTSHPTLLVSGGHVKCSVSRWRPQKVDKRMVLEHTHGLFITLTEFRLSTTFILIIIIIHATGILHQFSHSNMYTNTS
jgi:hypothetical protein